ncbi:ABC transporter ATP-binding protein [Candidatus Woesearchaeota archaeon]|nr:ABC transporter ATP-binding protein [Candidatus Woesearchaeota archaeon]
MPSIIEFRDISKSFGQNRVLSGFNLKIDKGEILGLIGPSGCGKSTLMKILLGIYQADSGKIFINKKDLSKNLVEIRRRVGFTTQENSFYYKLTVYENMRYYANLYNVKQENLRQYLENILREVDLYKARNVLADNISGGMKRRLDFAISLIHDPDILVLDEPTTGLDPILVRQFWAIVKKFNKRDKTIIVSSHIFREIEENSSRVGIMNNGKIVHIINLEQMKKSKELIQLYPLFKKYVEKKPDKKA